MYRRSETSECNPSSFELRGALGVAPSPPPSPSPDSLIHFSPLLRAPELLETLQLPLTPHFSALYNFAHAQEWRHESARRRGRYQRRGTRNSLWVDA